MAATRLRQMWAAGVAMGRNVTIAQGLHMVQLEMMAVVAALEEAVTVATSSRTAAKKSCAECAAVRWDHADVPRAHLHPHRVIIVPWLMGTVIL